MVLSYVHCKTDRKAGDKNCRIAWNSENNWPGWFSKIETVLRKNFHENKDVIWRDALVSPELM